MNPLGVQSDGVRSEGAGQVSSLNPGSTDLNPYFIWESKGRITGEGYTVEIHTRPGAHDFATAGSHSDQTDNAHVPTFPDHCGVRPES